MPYVSAEAKRACNREARKRWKKRNPDKVRAQKRDYHHRSGKHAVRLRRYGLSKADFDCLMLNQLGKCAICGVRFDDKAQPPCVDHDHRTEEV